MLDYESPSKHRPPLSVLKLPNDSPHKRFIAGMLQMFEQYTGYKNVLTNQGYTFTGTNFQL